MVVTIDDGSVTRVRADDADVFSRGFSCPKGIALGELHNDPDRLRTPMVREGDRLVPATWEAAYDRIRQGLGAVVRSHGAEALGIYLGNPNVHNAASTFYVPALVRALGTPNRFSASTVDQMPKQVASALVFGTELSVPVPDVDRTDLLVVIGANPLVSNGSLMTAPDMPGRLRALRKRGGRLVVIDPMRTRTAEAADTHLAIRPGTDAVLLACVARELMIGGADLGAASPYVDPADIDVLIDALAPFDPASTAAVTGIPEADVTGLVADIRSASSAAVYGRMGTTTAGWWQGQGDPVAFGTVASWLLDVIAVVSGNLDRPGGSMWALSATGGPTWEGEQGRGRGVRIPGARCTRVRGLPSVLGEFPVVAMAEEIDTPDPESGACIRAMVVVGGNPLVSTPDSVRLTAAFQGLDFLVCVDAYLSETSSRADVVLPVPSPLSRSHLDVVFANLAISNAVRYSAPAIVDDEVPDEGTTLLRLAGVLAGIHGADPEPSVDQLDDLVAWEVARRLAATPASALAGMDPGDILESVGGRRGVERLLDISLRGGPYSLTLDEVIAAPHGIDLGPLRPRLPDVLRTPSGRIDLVPEVLIAEVDRLAAAVASHEVPAHDAPRDSSEPSLLLIGRRQLRTNNSWLRNVPLLAGGSVRCTLQIHPEDARARGLADGAPATVSVVGRSVTATVELCSDVMPGVVSLPHGWGGLPAIAWGPVARERPGVNCNVLTPTGPVDPLAGTAVLNGLPVEVSATPA